MAIRAEYDTEADAMYVRVTNAAVARSLEQDHSIVVDVDADGQIVGIEILAPHRNAAKLPVIAERLGFLKGLGAIAASIREALAPPTYAYTIQATKVHVGVVGAGAVGAEAMSIASGSISIGSGMRSQDIEPEVPPVAEPA